MPVRKSPTTRRAAAVSLSALALVLSGGPAFALDASLPDSLTEPVDAATSLLPAPSPSPSPSPTPLVPLPKPVAEVVDPIVEAVTGGEPEPAPAPAGPVTQPPVTGQSGGSREVAAPKPAAAPAPAAGAAAATGGSGNAMLGSLGSSSGLTAGSSRTDAPLLGAPMIAPMPGFRLPNLPVPLAAAPLTAPSVEIQAVRPAADGAPAGLPVLVVAVAAIAVAGAAAGQVVELRRRRVRATA